MNLKEVIELLVEERNLDKEAVAEVVVEGIRAAYVKKYPYIDFDITYNSRSGQVDVFALKTVVSVIDDKDVDITLRKARTFDPSAEIGKEVKEPFTEPIGRIEMLMAKQIIAQKIKGLEQQVVYDEFKEKENSIINGMVHKIERAGFVVKMGDSMAFLPRSCSIPDETLRPGFPVRALLKEVLPAAKGEHQLILDRSSSDFVAKLLEIEIPEVFEGIVEVKKVVRAPGYKTKILVASSSMEIDPVGTCVGVGGVRIKPILKELGREKVDLIEYTENLEKLVADSLKPAEIDKVTVYEEEDRAVVWLDHDQRSFAIGKMGQNIALASRLTGLTVALQEEDIGDQADKTALALSAVENKIESAAEELAELAQNEEKKETEE